MGLLDLFKKKQPVEEVVKETKTEPPDKTYNREFKIAGVTFTNDDNVPRQKILQAIQEKKKPFDKQLDVMLEEYSFEDEPAISVKVNGQCIGNIPKEDVPFFKNNGDRMLGVSNLYVGGDKDLYWARVKVAIKTKIQ